MTSSLVITGASRGIGKRLATRFIQQGKYDVIAIVRDREAGQRLQREWESLSPTCRITLLEADLSDSEDVASLCRRLENEPNIDVFINNAGIFHGGTEAIMPLQLAELTAVNFLAPVQLIQAVLPAMKRKRMGYIFNIVSNAARRVLPGIGAYSASKHALLGFSESLMLDLLSHNIKLSNINPAFVDTDMTRDFPGVMAEDKIQTDDVVNCVQFLLSLSPGAIVPNVDLECCRFLR
ncbi:SDR family oxidoreductase [Lonsdalea quercina]|uniref:SDR family NAD(P)-dependent oxidoreductase n=1 Tax=Lonsdalea quercina TaxID=71657 RepID=UPI00047CD3ED|nr:SDR family oxidoreductase [Lonsdalea quercina]